MKNATIIIALLTLFSSCVLNKRIVYKTTDIQLNEEPKLSSIVLNIEEFSDKRKDSSENAIFFGTHKEYDENKQVFCINAERHYKKAPVNKQISNLLVEHLIKTGSFKNVVLNNKDSADYSVRGNLTYFYGKQEYSMAALVGSAFGLIGAIATANETTKGKVIFELTDLKIYDRNNQVVADIGTFRKEFSGEMHADASCWCIYDNVNTKLKVYFTQLITLIETELEDYTAKKSN
ncbi:MAG: hypothetical protein EAY81_08305 [Bacteroidetes bacterium]|nr:MAG: hypothetical protein EAY81_08305 [Bacteroidota bacterium]